MLMIVHNFSTQYNTEQFWQSSLLPLDRPSLLRCCLLEEKGHRGRPLTMNICSVSAMMPSNSILNLSEIEQFAAALLPLQYVTK